MICKCYDRLEGADRYQKNKTPGQPVIQVQDTKNEDRCMAKSARVFVSFVGQIREGDVATGKKSLDLPDRSA